MCRKADHLRGAGRQQAVAVTARGSGQTAGSVAFSGSQRAPRAFRTWTSQGASFPVSPAGNSGSFPLPFLQTITGYLGSGWARQGSEKDKQGMTWCITRRAGVSEDTGALGLRQRGPSPRTNDRGSLPGAADQAAAPGLKLYDFVHASLSVITTLSSPPC